MSIIFPDLRPSIKNVRAVVTTKWGKTGYRPIVIRSLESYFVDTAMDTDSDSWSFDFGDPTGEYMEIFKRDAEVRVQLFGVGTEGTSYIMTGIADEIGYSEEGTVTISGRDMSSLATDSIVPPKQYRHVRAWSIVEQQAREIGFKETSLARAGMVKKVQYTDGSESYWEFWYRLYRKEKMWIWCEPNGLLVASRLNYDGPISYYFGTPKDTDSQYVKRIYIPIENFNYRKSTQQRLGEVWVYGHRGDNGFLSISRDPTLKGWVKRPRKIMLDTESRTAGGAQKTGWEEIFEGKVGSREISLTIPDPGFMVRQNRIAHVNFPEGSVEGDYFIVGVRAQVGPDGFFQEIRLREKNYALSRRTPEDPKLVNTEPRASDIIDELGSGIASVAAMPTNWGAYFVKAAKEWHGPWDYNLFLATLIGICDQETGGAFLNERENGGPGGNHHEWTPPPTMTPIEAKHHGEPIPTIDLKTWRTRFANESGDGFVNRDYGVGPMQLTSLGVKHYADDHFKQGNRDEFIGGRWHPEHNIWAGARYLREMLQATVRDSGKDIDIWMGVMAYNRGSAGALEYFQVHGQPSPYAIQVKNKVYNAPGYLAGVKGAVEAAREAAKAARDNQTDIPYLQDSGVSEGMPSREQISVKFSEFSNPLFSSSLSRRQAIVYCALWGYYNRDLIDYTQGSQRMKDFAPPPNVPAATDCSGFSTWCYKSAGADDPNGLNYNGQGYTGTLWNHGQHISFGQIRPGDLVFYSNPVSKSSHVAVYIGDGKIVSHGSPSGPAIYPVKYRSDLHGFATYQV